MRMHKAYDNWKIIHMFFNYQDNNIYLSIMINILLNVNNNKDISKMNFDKIFLMVTIQKSPQGNLEKVFFFTSFLLNGEN